MPPAKQKHCKTLTICFLLPGWVYIASAIARGTGGLLPHRFTFTAEAADCSLLHCPSAFAGHPLDGALSYGSPDFPLENQAIACCTGDIIVYESCAVYRILYNITKEVKKKRPLAAPARKKLRCERDAGCFGILDAELPRLEVRFVDLFRNFRKHDLFQ